jgi:peptide/nickel transport system permease protein
MSMSESADVAPMAGSTGRTSSQRRTRREEMGRYWYKFKRNKISVVGLIVVLSVVAIALLSPWISPYPAAAFGPPNFSHMNQPPSLAHPFGTDEFGRDELSRVMYAFRYSLTLVGVVLGITVVPGVLLGLIAGYYSRRWFSSVIMLLANIFVAVPPLLLALSIATELTPLNASPDILTAMVAVTLAWWPWYTRLVYSTASSIRNEDFVKASELTGASSTHIMFREILPNILGSVLTKVSLDGGWVILIGAALSFVGFGAPSPTPDLGTMLSNGATDLPGGVWWTTLFPALGIVAVILGFNLLGDGINDMFSSGVK